MAFPVLTSSEHTTTEDRRRKAIGQFRELFSAGEVLQLATSFGKDSSVVLSLAMEALSEARRDGVRLPPVYVTSTDTGVENPVVAAHVREQVAALEDFAKREDLDIRVRVDRPALTVQWPVRVIGGQRLPVSPQKKHRECSQDMKVGTSKRQMRKMREELAADGYLELPITVLGTRTGESASRAGRMSGRGEGAHINTVTADNNPEKVIQRTFAPIAEWQLHDVWNYLVEAGTDNGYATYVANFDETVELYADSMGECNVADLSTSAAKGSSPCAGRHGCWSCTPVGPRDKSMEALIAQPQYAHLKGLNDLRNFVSAIHTDFDRRRWISASHHPVTGAAQIIPANFNGATCEYLLRVLLSLDVAEVQRAEAFDALVAAGREEEDAGLQEILAADPIRKAEIEGRTLPASAMPSLKKASERAQNKAARYIERMRRPMFQHVTPEVLLAIDWYWSQSALTAPHQALAIYNEVVNEGKLTFAPSEPPVVEQKPVPAVLWRPVEYPNNAAIGALGPMVDGFAGECGQMEWALDKERGEWVRRFVTRDVPSFDVDLEGAMFFLHEELDTCLQINRDFHAGWIKTRTIAAARYLQFGVIAVARSHRNAIDDLLKRSRMWEHNGLAGDTPLDHLRAGCLTEAEHTAWVRELEAEAAAEAQAAERAEQDRRERLARRAPGLGDVAADVLDARAQMRAELPRLLAREIAIADNLAERRKAGRPTEGVTIEGIPMDAELLNLRRQIKAWRAFALEGACREYTQGLWWRIVAQVHDRAATLLAGEEACAERFAWGFGMAMPWSNATARRRHHERQANEARSWLQAEEQLAMGF